MLMQAGTLRGARTLTASAAANLAQAVGAAERGRWESGSPVAASDLDGGNPFRSRLKATLAASAPLPDVRPDGALAAAPDRQDTQGSLDAAAALLTELAALFSVTLRNGEAAASTALVPTPVEPARPRTPTRRSSPKPTARAEPPPPRPIIQAAPRSAGGSSTSFWSLMDSWRLPDLDALTLLGHSGGLTKKGTRPRFRLVEREAAVLARMHDIDDALAALELAPADWLRERIDAAPFAGRTPLDLMLREPAAALSTLQHFIFQIGLRRSLGGK